MSNIKPLQKAVNEQMPSFKGHLQQDVQEFFCQLLSKLNTEKLPNGLNMTHNGDFDHSEEILNCVVNRMFTGAWQSEVTCIGCGNSNQNKEQFNTLPLEFPNKYHKQVSDSINVVILGVYSARQHKGRHWYRLGNTTLFPCVFGHCSTGRTSRLKFHLKIHT